MKSLFANADAGTIGLIFFVGLFAVIAFYALKPSKKDELESHRFIPLSEDE